MLKLKRVSKFYYNKGIISSGFSKVNLNLNIGEFVVITGESGSGKSTLLNVISGLDTYEEGEMYINGEETSYYDESDFERYRKKYIANIFQNFNLINSYTVYENIELMYNLNGITDIDIKNKIDDILVKVNLYKHKNTKVSKLSGGEKQRVAIARALAKDTPIIVADEPTGNLDSNSAKSIIKLLYEISKDKLVIIVTHNYEQVKDYATRKIKMHDGKIIEDRTIKNIDNNISYIDKEYGNIILKDKIKLSFKNTFNIVPKFLLLLLVYSFITLAVIFEYTSNLKSNYYDTFNGYNTYFGDSSDKRIVIKKKDKTYFSSLDYEKINSISNVDYIVENDILINNNFTLTDDSIYIWGSVKDISTYEDGVDVGKLPSSFDEVILLGSPDEYYLSLGEDILNKEYSLIQDSTGNKVLFNKLKIVGIKYVEEEIYKGSSIYVSNSVLLNIVNGINKSYSTIKYNLNDITIDQYSGYDIYPSKVIEKGKVLLPDELSYACKNYICNNNTLDILVDNIYYDTSISLSIYNTYNDNNIEKLTEYKKDEVYNKIFINEEDYYSLFERPSYQSSVYIKDVKNVRETINELENNGLDALYIKDTLVDYSAEVRVFVNLIKFIVIVFALLGLFFISYFIIKIILKSRNIYFSTLRILGARKKDIKTLIIFELNNILNISYILILLFFLLINNNVIKNAYIKDLISYLKFTDYIYLYIILFFISLLISIRYSNSIFKKSAMSAYRSEV